MRITDSMPEYHTHDAYLDGRRMDSWFEADEETGRLWVWTPIMQMGDTEYRVLYGKVELKIKEAQKLPMESQSRG